MSTGYVNKIINNNIFFKNKILINLLCLLIIIMQVTYETSNESFCFSINKSVEITKELEEEII